MLLSLHPFFLCGCCVLPSNKVDIVADINDPNIHAEMVVPELIKTTGSVQISPKVIKLPVIKKKDWGPSVIAKVKFFEGFSPTVYRCEANELTIGYGFTGNLTNRKYIGKAEAAKILEKELGKCQAEVKKYVKVHLTNAQLWCLTDFTYNCGAGNLQKLVNGKGRLNSGNYSSVPKLLPQYAKGNGKFLKGLLIRRKWEAQLWSEK